MSTCHLHSKRQRKVLWVLERIVLHEGKDSMRVHKYFSSLILMAAMVGPVALGAIPHSARPGDDDRDHDRDHKVQRYYDRDHHDYHEWNDRESRAYGRWETENSRKHREFARRRRAEQAHYWNWRHSHPDND